MITFLSCLMQEIETSIKSTKQYMERNRDPPELYRVKNVLRRKAPSKLERKQHRRHQYLKWSVPPNPIRGAEFLHDHPITNKLYCR